jgi:hypothetical protein
MIAPRHLVQFYEDETFLTEAVASFVKVGLQVHDTLIIVTTPSHCRDLHNMLTPGELGNTNLMFFNVTSLLADIAVDGCPNQSRFMEAIGNVILRACQRGRVRVYSEMVPVLWAEGKHQAALRLEELWDTLQTTHPVFRMVAHPNSTLSAKENPHVLCQPYTEVRYQNPGKARRVIDHTYDVVAALCFLSSALSERVAFLE